MKLDHSAIVVCHLPDDRAGAVAALAALKILSQSFKSIGESCCINFPVEFDDVVEQFNLYSDVEEFD